MYKNSICLVVLLAILSGCASLKEGLRKAVLMDYDQVNNFRNYTFDNFWIDWGGSASESGITGVGTSPNIGGFWVTFLICNLRNEGADAQPFPYNINKFYVEYDGKKHYHQPLQTYTYSSIPHGLPGNPSVTGLVNETMRKETQLGPDTDTFQKGYYPTVNYRLAIYVTRSTPGVIDVTPHILLRYEGYPNIMNPRNQAPLILGPNSTKKSDLRTTCRPQAQ